MEHIVKQCRSCKKKIIWAETDQGRKIPLDAMPSADGTYVLIDPPTGDLPLAKFRPQDELADRAPRRVAHFATCPNASEHRKAARR